jgi:hypothetical protein
MRASKLIFTIIMLISYSLSFAQNPEIIGGKDAVLQNLLYPPLALKTGISGKVLLVFSISDVGKPYDFETVFEIPKDMGFEDNAIYALKKCKFLSVAGNGENYCKKAQITILFKPKSVTKEIEELLKSKNYTPEIDNDAYDLGLITLEESLEAGNNLEELEKQMKKYPHLLNYSKELLKLFYSCDVTKFKELLSNPIFYEKISNDKFIKTVKSKLAENPKISDNELYKHLFENMPDSFSLFDAQNTVRFRNNDKYIDNLKSKLTILNKITDRDLLKKMYKSDSPYDIKIKFFEIIEDQEFFEKTFLEEKNYYMKHKILNKITDQERLMNIFTKTENSGFKVAILEKINDQKFLKKVFLKDENFTTTMLVTKKIEDTEFLISNYHEKLDSEIKRIITDKLTNQKDIMKIFQKESDPFTFDYIFSKINDKKLLWKYANLGESEYLIDHFKEDKGYLKRLYQSSENENIKFKIFRIFSDDQIMLKDIYYLTHEERIYSHIISRIGKYPQLLKNIYSNADTLEEKLMIIRYSDYHSSYDFLNETLLNENNITLINKAINRTNQDFEYLLNIYLKRNSPVIRAEIISSYYGCGGSSYPKLAELAIEDTAKVVRDALFEIGKEYFKGELSGCDIDTLKIIIDTEKKDEIRAGAYNNYAQKREHFYEFHKDEEEKYNFLEDKYLTDFPEKYKDYLLFGYNGFLVYYDFKNGLDDSLKLSILSNWRYPSERMCIDILKIEKSPAVRLKLIDLLYKIDDPEEIINNSSSTEEKKAVYKKTGNKEFLELMLKEEQNDTLKLLLKTKVNNIHNDVKSFLDQLAIFPENDIIAKSDSEIKNEIKNVYKGFIDYWAKENRFRLGKIEEESVLRDQNSKRIFEMSVFCEGSPQFTSNEYDNLNGLPYLVLQTEFKYSFGHENDIYKLKNEKTLNITDFDPVIDGHTVILDNGIFNYLELKDHIRDKTFNVYWTQGAAYSFPTIHAVEFNNEMTLCRVFYSSGDHYFHPYIDMDIYRKIGNKWKFYKHDYAR